MATTRDPRSVPNILYDEPPVKPPPILATGPLAWMRQNLFKSTFDTTLTIVAAIGLVALTGGFLTWAITQANWLAGLEFGLKGFIGAIFGNFRSPGFAVAGGLAIGIVESLAAGYISSAYKDVVSYGALLIYLLIRGGVFITGRAALSHSSH